MTLSPQPFLFSFFSADLISRFARFVRLLNQPSRVKQKHFLGLKFHRLRCLLKTVGKQMFLFKHFLHILRFCSSVGEAVLMVLKSLIGTLILSYFPGQSMHSHPHKLPVTWNSGLVQFLFPFCLNTVVLLILTTLILPYICIYYD